MDIEMDEIPLTRKALLTQRIMVAVDERTKHDLMILKHQHRVDITEWIRKLIRSELPKIKLACERKVL